MSPSSPEHRDRLVDVTGTADETGWAGWIIDSTDDAVISVTADERVVTWNNGAERLFGYPAREMVGRQLAVIVPPAIAGEERRLMRRVCSGMRVEQRRILRVHRGGALVPVRVATSPIYDDHGCVVGVSVICHDITEEQRYEDRLMYQAAHDPLTDLPNRALALDRLGHALALASRSSRSVALLFVDVDDFKDVNDTFGHDAGDDLLREIAARIVAEIRPCDTAARLGGDEFVVICEEFSPEPVSAKVEAERLGERIALIVAQPYVVGGWTIKTTVSIGCAIPQPGQSPNDVLRAADSAMYASKQRRTGYGGVTRPCPSTRPQG